MLCSSFSDHVLHLHTFYHSIKAPFSLDLSKDLESRVFTDFPSCCGNFSDILMRFFHQPCQILLVSHFKPCLLLLTSLLLSFHICNRFDSTICVSLSSNLPPSCLIHCSHLHTPDFEQLTLLSHFPLYAFNPPFGTLLLPCLWATHTTPSFHPARHVRSTSALFPLFHLWGYADGADLILFST